MDQSHDRTYHRLFSEPALLEDLVRNFVDEPWVQELDFARMERVNTKFHAESLERREGDIIMRIPFLHEPREMYLLLLLEFQSSIDPWMVVRFGAYVHLLYQQLIKEYGVDKQGQLPPVFPLLLYNGETQWKVATDLSELIALPKKSPLWKYQPQMRYYLVDESCYPQGKAGSLSGLLFKLENINNPAELNAAVAELLRDIPPHLHSLKRAFAVCITHVLAMRKGLSLELKDAESLEEVNVMLAKRIEIWENQILEKGIERGIGQGIERGQAKVLLKQLTFKFGILPKWVAEKIEHAKPEQLDLWAERILYAQTLDEIFL